MLKQAFIATDTQREEHSPSLARRAHNAERIMSTEQTAQMFEKIAQYEAEHPGYAEAEKHLTLTMEQYQATLSALYRPTIITSNSADLPVHANLE